MVIEPRVDVLERQKKYSTSSPVHCCSIFNYEMLRLETAKLITKDEEFFKFLRQWENVCLAEQSIAFTMTPTDKALVELVDPKRV